MASRCEPLLNIVKLSEPKVLCPQGKGSSQKASGPEQGLKRTLPQTQWPPVERRRLNHPEKGLCAKRGKPVVLLQGKASRKTSPWGCG